MVAGTTLRRMLRIAIGCRGIRKLPSSHAGRLAVGVFKYAAPIQELQLCEDGYPPSMESKWHRYVGRSKAMRESHPADCQIKSSFDKFYLRVGI